MGLGLAAMARGHVRACIGVHYALPRPDPWGRAGAAARMLPLPPELPRSFVDVWCTVWGNFGPQLYRMHTVHRRFLCWLFRLASLRNVL